MDDTARRKAQERYNHMADTDRREEVARIHGACLTDPNEHYDPTTVLWLIMMYNSAAQELSTMWEYMTDAGLCIECGRMPKDCDCGRWR
jgi:hypothetical protein